jgi:hypothetical protein
LLVKLEGDLHARANGEKTAIDLLKQDGKAVLSYGHLVARDSAGHLLPAHMETNSEGDEIALVVQDSGATYPIDIDPITATQEQKLTKPFTAQAGTEFGDAVAIGGDVAVIGAFREDLGSGPSVDVGQVYIFTRSGSAWTFKLASSPSLASSSQCGWSVAVSTFGDRVAFGCPGLNSNSGDVFLMTTPNDWSSASVKSMHPASLSPGNRFGESVGVNVDTIVIGAPGDSVTGFPHSGGVYIFKVNANLDVVESGFTYDPKADAYLGTSVAVDDNNVILGSRAQSRPGRDGRKFLQAMRGSFTLSPV